MTDTDQTRETAEQREAREYASITIRFDHMMVDAPEGEVVQAFYLSTQDDIESLLAIFAYFGESELAQQPSTLHVLQDGARSEAPVYVYVNSLGQIHVVMSVPTYEFLRQDPSFGNGSSLELTDALTKVIATAHNADQERRGDKSIAPFLLLDFDQNQDD